MTPIYAFLGGEQWHPETLVRLAATAEDAGFDGVMVSDHFNPWVDDAGAGGFTFATLGAVARATRRLRIATGVTTPLFHYHPAMVAQAAATLDRLSGGRFALGVGTGERINEVPFGVEFPPYPERAARLSEALGIIRSLLDGSEVTAPGPYYRTDGARLASPPLGRVPIWVAAQGPRSAALAGRLGDALLTSVKDPAETAARVVGPAAEAAAAAGRPPPPIVATRWAILAADEDEAWEALAPWRGLRVPGREQAGHPRELRERADRMERAAVLARFSRAAEPRALLAAYRPLVKEVGAAAVVMQVAAADMEAALCRIGADVLPGLRR